jgi:hypothetical protein
VTKQPRAYVPSMSDALVKARTGRDWAGWFRTLDKAGAVRLAHRQIADILARRHQVPGWWCQMVTVEYERARGLRQRHQSASGFSVAVSKTLATALPQLYEATARTTQRRKWFPRGEFEASSQTREKYFRGRWKQNARVEIGFYARGSDKSQIAVQVSRLAHKDEVEPVRRAWRAALAKLQVLLQD